MAAVRGKDVAMAVAMQLLVLLLLASGGVAAATPTSALLPAAGTSIEGVPVPQWAQRRLQRLQDLVVGGATADAVVSKDGSTPYSTVQKAVDAAPAAKGKHRYFVIHIRAGIYDEIVTVARKKVILVGDGMDRTIVTGRRCPATGHDTPSSATMSAHGHGFMARDITVQNTAGPDAGQAVALRSTSNQSVYFRCGIQGFQDTLYADAGVHFYKSCLISGTVDFIFGNARAVFQECDILARRSVNGKHNIITAQGRDGPDHHSGFVFQACSVKPMPGDNLSGTPTFLGRPWKTHSHVVFMRCWMESVVDPAGWVPWNASTPVPDTVFYAEYNNTGPGAKTQGRVQWLGFHLIKDAIDAANFTVDAFIKGRDWLPKFGISYKQGLE